MEADSEDVGVAEQGEITGITRPLLHAWRKGAWTPNDYARWAFAGRRSTDPRFAVSALFGFRNKSVMCIDVFRRFVLKFPYFETSREVAVPMRLATFVHISDLHFGPVDPRTRDARAIALASKFSIFDGLLR